MFIFEYIDPLVFLITLCIGLIYTYYVTPYPQLIVKYPTPFNSGKVIYTDNSGSCYKYKIKKTNCPIDQNKIKHFSPQ